MQDHLEIAISNQASQLYNFEYFQEYVKILEIFILKSKSPTVAICEGIIYYHVCIDASTFQLAKTCMRHRWISIIR